MKKLRRVGVVLFLVTSIFATSVLAAPSTSQIQNQKNKAEQEMNSLKNELAELMVSVNETEMQLISKGEEIIAATEQLAEAEEKEKQQYESMVKRIVAMYEKGNSSALALLFESGSIAQMLQNMDNVQTIHEYDRNQLQEYTKTKETIATLKTTLETEQQQLQTLQKQLESKQKTLSDKITAKKNQIKNFEEQLAAAAAEAARQAANAADKNVLNSGSGGVKYTGSGDQSVGNAIVAKARTYLGVPYAWGGNSYNGIDCSGLTKACHAAVGIYIDRWSGHQAIGGKAIGSVAEAKPGDIICYSGHVAIYIGNERVIHAPHTGSYVKEATVYLKEIIAIRRYW